jgi:hypothetical protein
MLSGVRETGRQLTDADITAFELGAGVRLPLEYRRFLLADNGGRPVEPVFPIVGLANNPYGRVQILFGLDRDIESVNLDWNQAVMSDQLPAEWLPIGATGTGDVLCLDVRGNGGPVVLCDEHVDVGAETAPRLYHVADSFRAFVESLQPDTD